MRFRNYLMLAGAMALAIPAFSATSAAASSRPGIPASAGPGAIAAHQVSGCGEPLTILTPGTSGYAPFAAKLRMPDGPGTLLARAAQHHVRWLSGLTCRVGHRGHPLPGPGTGARFNAQPSSNWSGYQDSLPAAPNYVQAFWTVPQVGLPQPGDTDFSSVWPGIGSGNGGKLIQDGTEQDITCANVNNVCGSVTRIYDFWFEIVPGEAEQVVTNLVPAPGDSVATSTFWSSSTGAEFGMCDYTQSVCVTGSQASSAPDDTAEWIIERPTVQTSANPPVCVLPPLADFGTVNITGAGYNETPQGNLENVMSQGSPQAVDLFDFNNIQLDSTGGVGGDGASFGVTYFASGQSDTVSC